MEKENLPPRSRERTTTSPAATTAKTPDSATRQSRSAQANFRRRSAAEWINRMTGVLVPSSTDHSFRKALKDGIILCEILNVIRPGCINRILRPAEGGNTTCNQINSMENVSNFLTALRGLQFPLSSTFSLADIESTGWEDRPRIAECILTLKRFYEAERNAEEGLADSIKPFLPASPVQLENLKPFQISRAAERLPSSRPPTPVQRRASCSGLTPDFNGVRPHYFQTTGEEGSLTPAANMTQIMQQCTKLLKDRVRASLSPQPQSQGSSANAQVSQDMAIETMGPVVESILGSLTQEYESRLQAKEHEVSAAQHEVRATHLALKKAQEDLYEAQRALQENANLLPVCSPQPGMSEDQRKLLEGMQENEQRLKFELDTRDAEIQRRAADLQDARRLLEAEQAVHQQILEENAALKLQAEELFPIAEKYAATAEENRRLYNEVQDLKGNIRVFCRIRPCGTTGDASPGCAEEGLDGELAMYNPQAAKRKLFKFDKIFGPNSNQEQVYEDTKALIRSVLDGYNVCIFAYGQTGSGKTHTMSGTQVQTLEGRGINYRALDDLFALNESRQSEVSYEINVQLLEIYNEQLRDLLDTSRSQRRLEIRSTERSGLNVPDATQVPVACTEDVLEVMSVGAANRAVAETKMNERSSRSHSVLTVIVDGVSKLDNTKLHGCLHLIDLAGSERVGRSEATGERLEEAKHINRSLSALGDVMAALANRDRHVPYRNSRLTQLLQDSLQGQAKAMMFVHVSPEVSSFSESISTLSFGARVSEITLGAARKNIESGAMLDAREAVGRLQAEAAAARAEAAAAKEQFRHLQAEVERLKMQAGRDAEGGASPLSRSERPVLPRLRLQGPGGAQIATPRANLARTARPLGQMGSPTAAGTPQSQAKVPRLAFSGKTPLRQIGGVPATADGASSSRTPLPSNAGPNFISDSQLRVPSSQRTTGARFSDAGGLAARAVHGSRANNRDRANMCDKAGLCRSTTALAESSRKTIMKEARTGSKSVRRWT